jgi:hypothetical protein
MACGELLEVLAHSVGVHDEVGMVVVPDQVCLLRDDHVVEHVPKARCGHAY